MPKALVPIRAGDGVAHAGVLERKVTDMNLWDGRSREASFVTR